MLSLTSCTVSVFRRLSANMKAPVSTVSRSRVAACCCSLVGSSLHATWALSCNRLFTVSTIAWDGGEKAKVTKRNRRRCRPIVVHCQAKSNEDSIHWDVTMRLQWDFFFHLSCWQIMATKRIAMQKKFSNACKHNKSEKIEAVKHKVFEPVAHNQSLTLFPHISPGKWKVW